MTAEGLLCRQYLGWPKDDPRLATGVNLILSRPVNWEDRDVYYWYYATQSCTICTMKSGMSGTT